VTSVTSLLQVKIQVTKDVRSGIPLWIIILSILIGLLILALVIFALWKVSITILLMLAQLCTSSVQTY